VCYRKPFEALPLDLFTVVEGRVLNLDRRHAVLRRSIIRNTLERTSSSVWVEALAEDLQAKIVRPREHE
jgi:hypothetical protein